MSLHADILTASKTDIFLYVDLICSNDNHCNNKKPSFLCPTSKEDPHLWGW